MLVVVAVAIIVGEVSVAMLVIVVAGVIVVKDV